MFTYHRSDLLKLDTDPQTMGRSICPSPSVKRGCPSNIINTENNILLDTSSSIDVDLLTQSNLIRQNVLNLISSTTNWCLSYLSVLAIRLKSMADDVHAQCRQWYFIKCCPLPSFCISMTMDMEVIFHLTLYHPVSACVQWFCESNKS